MSERYGASFVMTYIRHADLCDDDDVDRTALKEEKYADRYVWSDGGVRRATRTDEKNRNQGWFKMDDFDAQVGAHSYM